MKVTRIAYSKDLTDSKYTALEEQARIVGCQRELKIQHVEGPVPLRFGNKLVFQVVEHAQRNGSRRGPGKRGALRRAGDALRGRQAREAVGR